MNVEFDAVTLTRVEFVQLTLMRTDWMIVHPFAVEKLKIERLSRVLTTLELSTVALLQFAAPRDELNTLHEDTFAVARIDFVILLPRTAPLDTVELRHDTEVPFTAENVQFVAATLVRFDAFCKPPTNVPLSTVVLAQVVPESLLFTTEQPVSLD